MNMMQRKDLFLRIAVFTAPVLSAIAVILQAFALSFEFNRETEYYIRDALIPAVFGGLVIGALLLFIILALVNRRTLQTEPAPDGLFLFFTQALAAVGFAVAAIYGIFSLSSAGDDPFLRVFMALAAFFAAAGSAYMLLCLLRIHSSVTTLLSFGPVFYCLFSAMVLYFDKSKQINHPGKALSLAAFLVLSLCFLSLCRTHLGRYKPALHFFISSAALVLGMGSSLPSLLYTMANNAPALLSVVDDFTVFAATLYILAQHLRLLPYKNPERHTMVEQMEAAEVAPVEMPTIEQPEGEPATETEEKTEENA